MLVASIGDMIVFYYSPCLDLYGEDENMKQTENQEMDLNKCNS